MGQGYSSRQAVALFWLSAGALCFEVVLLRLYAVQQFYHFAFLVVGLAVLGTAAGGVALARFSRPAPPAWLAVSFSISVVIAYTVLNIFLFDSYAIAWDRRQILILFLYFGSAALPFFFAGWFTGAALATAGASAGRAYAASLVGSAAGPLLALVATTAAQPESAIFVASAAGLLSAALMFQPRSTQRLAALGVVVLAWLALQPPGALDLRLSPNKALAQARTYPGASTSYREDSGSARIDILENAGVHSFPGLSLGYPPDLPRQAGLFLDGDGPLPLTILDPQAATTRALALATPAGITCLLRPGARVLILRPGTALDAALALGCGAGTVDVPVDQPLVAEALLGPYRESTFGLLENPRLHLLPSSSRAAVERTDRAYDVIKVSLSDPFRPVASGAFSLSETDDLTIETFTSALDRLAPEGLLTLDRWLTTPPAESLRGWATVLEALRRVGLDPADHVIAFRTLRTSTIVASSRPWRSSDLDRIRAFLESNRFDPIYLPNLQPEETNRFVRIPDDPYPDLFLSLLASPGTVVPTYPYQIQPATDDRPFFFHFFRWEQTPEALATLGRTWQPFGGSGYLVLVALLLLVAVLAGALLLATRFPRRSDGRVPRRGWIYFAGIGAGYLFTEVALIQRLTLPLEQPTVAFILVASTLLLASGVGSQISTSWKLRPILILLGLMTATLAMGMRAWLPATLQWSYPARIIGTVILLAPLGLLMGVPFPAGLRRYAAGNKVAVGMAWAVNGAASAVAGVLSSMVMLDLGIAACLGLGGLAYWISGAAYDPAPPSSPGPINATAYSSGTNPPEEWTSGTNRTPPRLTVSKVS